jgi:hypothetical protein
MELINPGRSLDSLSFSTSISVHKFSKFYKLQVMEMRESFKMVAACEVVKTKTSYTNKEDKDIINGANLVRRQPSTPSAPLRDSKQLDPPVEELKVLPSDEGFSWANENYNSLQRSADVWSFVLSLRVRVLLDNAKWAYLGGFTEDKQVGCCCLLLYVLVSAITIL